MLENHRTVNHYGIQLDETINILHRICGGKPPQPAFNKDELDPVFDYDFSSIEDDGRRYMRGGFQYKRHYGWKRVAIKVLAKYGDDTWLGRDGMRTGRSPGGLARVLSRNKYEGYPADFKRGYKSGSKAVFGRCIYTSPDLEMIERLYTREFNYQGKTYKISFQNRVNPVHLQIIPVAQTTLGADYWLSH